MNNNFSSYEKVSNSPANPSPEPEKAAIPETQGKTADIAQKKLAAFASLLRIADEPKLTAFAKVYNGLSDESFIITVTEALNSPVFHSKAVANILFIKDKVGESKQKIINEFLEQDEILDWRERVNDFIRKLHELRHEREPNESEVLEFKRLLEEHADKISAPDRTGSSIAHLLAKAGSCLPLVDVVVKLDPQILFTRDQTTFNNTPIMWAIANAHNEMALELLKYDQDLNVQDTTWKNTALQLAVIKGYISQDGQGNPVTVPNLILVKEMLKKDLDVNLQNKYGDTALHYAFLRRDVEMIAAILEKNPDVTLRDQQNRTPFEMLEYPYEIAKKILNRAARPFLLDESTFDENLEIICERFPEFLKDY